MPKTFKQPNHEFDNSKGMNSPGSHMIQILDSDIRHMRNLIATISIHLRHTRTINILGTELKVVAVC